ncbi:hypothetical protein B0H16DRAFT_1572973 [Mycena metata]|uniref:Uncharacterized protein n=1 Tax=Mycena metata TaxID=1033252 RepID=A0AAD7I9H3_9AGAR|nr:hypothetical protein B0H16DRAFT_1572973 [Mycena metata]
MFSVPSNLGSRKRKAEEVLDWLRTQRPFSTVEEEKWSQISTKIFEDPSLYSSTVKSRPFTDARPFHDGLFEPDVGDIDVELPTCALVLDDAVPPPSTVDRYDEAAAALRKNVLWKSVQQHVLMARDTSSRTAVDLVVLTAVDLAQQQIGEKGAVDDALCQRHSLVGSKHRDASGRKIGSWVVLQQDVEVEDQLLLPGLALHGIFDYIVGIVSAKDARNAFRSGEGYLTPLSLYCPPELLYHTEKTLTSIVEAKAGMEDDPAWYQATAQGAALCFLTERTSVINALTDGVYWQFFRVSKTPDEVVKPTRSRSRRRAATFALPKEEKKPFKVASTQILNIFNSKGRDLAIVLRLLTLSILETPEDCEKLAAGA